MYTICSLWKKDIYVLADIVSLAMRSTLTVVRPELSSLTAFVAAHPRAFLVVVFLLVLLLSQGTVSAAPGHFGGIDFVDPYAGHGASTGP